MKIVEVDNYARETVNDVLVCENVTPYFAQRIMNALNERYSGEQASKYYRAVEDSYELYVYDPR